MAIVMGLDQHRAQITAEWLDTETGELARRRVSPAHRAGVRQFCEEFRGPELEVALEATTGWRFVAEELRRFERWCIWRRRPRQPHGVGTRSARRPIVRMPGSSASC
jgi:hypothetical protein